MEVIRYQKPDLASLEIINSLTSVSFFCSAGFGNLWQSQGGRLVYWIVKDSHDIVAVLPGVEFGRKPLCRFQAMPDGCYGRLFFHEQTDASKDEIAKLLTTALKKAGYVKVFLYDYYGTMGQPEGFETSRLETMLVDISSPDWKPPHESIRRAVRKAEKEGIKITPFNPDTDFQKFIRLMFLTEERHGRKPKYAENFFKNLADLTGEDDRIRWVWCEHENEPVASHIYFIEKHSLLYWQGYFDLKFSFLRPNQYIQYMLARGASQAGLKFINLGASPADAEGLKAYKARWGGKSVSYNCYSLKSVLGKLV